MSEFKCITCEASEGETAEGSSVPAVPMVPPHSNPYWDRLKDKVCGGCWVNWKDMEVKIINEYRLNLLDRDHRKLLKKHMNDFLNLDGSGSGGKAPDAVASEWTPDAAE